MEMGDGDGMATGWRWDGDGMEVGWRWDGGRMVDEAGGQRHRYSRTHWAASQVLLRVGALNSHEPSPICWWKHNHQEQRLV